MAGFIPDEVLQSIRSRVDIVELISEYIPLQKKGRNYSGFCPFHQENDPSFTVSYDKQIFYCFGCAAGGDVFKFLMLYEGFSFREAVEHLAKRLGITIPASAGKEDNQKYLKRNKALEINAQAKDYFKSVLIQGKEAAFVRKYLLDQRGLSWETVQKFELGYAPESWNSLVNHLTQKGAGRELLVEIGLAAKGTRGAYDRFRSRIMFPIRDARGNIAGFGGRIVNDGHPKYLNTPETDFFSKRLILYGLYEARRSIMDAGYAVIMEGYMDVISAYQHGITNAVASLGTSLTKEQAQLLMRYTKDVYIAYDSDAAGVAATMRGLDIMQETGCRVKVIKIPGQKDPDDFLKEYGLDGWNSLISSAESLIEFKLGQVKAGSKTFQLEQVLPSLANIQDEVERAEAVQLTAARLHTTWDAVAGALKRYINEKRKKDPNSDKNTKNKHNIIHNVQQLDARTKAEKVLLKIMLEKPEFIPIVQKQLGNNFFKDKKYNSIFSTALQLMEQSDYSPAVVFNDLEEDEQRVLGDLFLEELPGGDDDLYTVIQDYIQAMKKYQKKEQRENLMDILLEAEKKGDQQRVNKILNELNALY